MGTTRIARPATARSAAGLRPGEQTFLGDPRLTIEGTQKGRELTPEAPESTLPTRLLEGRLLYREAQVLTSKAEARVPEALAVTDVEREHRAGGFEDHRVVEVMLQKGCECAKPRRLGLVLRGAQRPYRLGSASGRWVPRIRRSSAMPRVSRSGELRYHQCSSTASKRSSRSGLVYRCLPRGRAGPSSRGSSMTPATASASARAVERRALRAAAGGVAGSSESSTSVDTPGIVAEIVVGTSSDSRSCIALTEICQERFSSVQTPSQESQPSAGFRWSARLTGRRPQTLRS